MRGELARALWVLRAVLLCQYNEDADVTYNGGPHDAKPYRCTSCRRIGLTTAPRPHCLGEQGKRHDPAPMKLVSERYRAEAVKLIIR